MLAMAHIRVRVLSLLRTPAYVVGTLAVPSLILVFLGIGLADTTAEANAIMASFTIIAVMGIAFFQFGVGIAESRASPWSTYERILPASIVRPSGGNRRAGSAVRRICGGTGHPGRARLHAGRSRCHSLVAPWSRAGGRQRAPGSARHCHRLLGVLACSPADRQCRLSRPRVRRRPVHLSRALPRRA